MVRALASHHRDRFKSWRQHHLWVDFVVGSLPCSEGFFQIPVRSGTRGYIQNSSQELLSALWVNNNNITINDGIKSGHPALNNFMSMKYELQ